MIKTQNLLMVRLMWPPPAKDATKKDKDHHKKILAAARRCLHQHAPLTFAETGFQLLRKSREAELIECLDGALVEIELSTADVLVMLTVPEWNEYTEYYYAESIKLYLNEMAQGLEALADKVTSKPPRIDAFQHLFDKLDSLSGYVKSDELPKIHQMLVKLEDWDYIDEKRKGHILLGKLADKVRGLEL